nr:BCCT family transporter [Brachybacterium equifaecis]
MRDITYPHSIHPALVPGVSVEDQKIRYGVDRWILVVVGALIVGFVVWGIAAPAQVFAVSGAALTWVMQNLAWMFSVLAIGLVLLLVVLAFSRYGRIPLGLDGEKPEYSTASWAAMLFAAGIGIGIISFGPFEPLTYYLSPRPGAPYEPGTAEAMKGAMAQSALHWGVNAWAIYAIVGLSVAYVSYRRGKVPLMSGAVVVSLWGGSTASPAARIIDGLAIIATLFGTAATLGIGALQIARGVEVVSGTGNSIALIIIMVLTIGTIISAVSGVARGIRWLSNINMVLSIALAVFFFVVGPTVFLINIIPGAILEYVSTMPAMLSANMSKGESMQAFLSAWTGFYWAWWVSWAPFVGVVVAKISRGRTIRQFVLGVLAIFFITTADSASIVNSQLSQKGNPEPNRLVTAFWVLCMAGIAVVILLFGGKNALQGLQNLVAVTATPFEIILVLMAVALVKLLRTDPIAIRDRFQAVAVENAVKHGVREYGDSFALAVEPTDPGDARATGGEFDSTAEEVTEWYVRTDEDGNPVEFDYETGEYLEDAEPVDTVSAGDAPEALPADGDQGRSSAPSGA